MGFGLLALGYLFLSFYITGADLPGYIIMLVALSKLSRNVGKEFKKCIIAVLILIPVGVFNLFGFVDTAFELGYLKEEYTKVSYDDEMLEEMGMSANDSAQVSQSDNVEETSDNAVTDVIDKASKTRKGVKIAEAIFNGLFIFGSLCFHYFFYQAIRPLCSKTQELKKISKAKRNSAINILFFSLWGLLLGGGANVALVTVITIAHFGIIALNFIYIYSCYATFAYESDVEENEGED